MGIPIPSPLLPIELWPLNPEGPEGMLYSPQRTLRLSPTIKFGACGIEIKPDISRQQF